MRRTDLAGTRFGRLTGLWPAGRYRREIVWACQCDCGRVRAVLRNNLRTGNTKSCGCLNRDQATQAATQRFRKHGHSYRDRKPTPEYKSWQSAKERCFLKTHPKYCNWGGRGITMCDRWKDSFEAFLADMGRRPMGTSLDRFPNNDGNYEPGNCRWATPKEQASNKRQHGKRSDLLAMTSLSLRSSRATSPWLDSIVGMEEV
jgi:hypothetical protein